MKPKVILLVENYSGDARPIKRTLKKITPYESRSALRFVLAGDK